MSKKKLLVEDITNELEGASLYFPYAEQPQKETPPLSRDPQPQPPPQERASSTRVKKITRASRNQKIQSSTGKPATTPEIKQESSHASTLASSPASTNNSFNDVIRDVRKVVRQVGREPIFLRVTDPEKNEINSIVYTFNELYRDEGRKTSENEVGRIALNHLMQDYRQNGENSILAKVLAALNA